MIGFMRTPSIFSVAIGLSLCLLAGCTAANTTTESSASSFSSMMEDSSIPAAQIDIHITAPHMNAKVQSPLVVTGQARGSWYFEASFPIRLLDGNGNVIANAPAEAQGNWMTEDFVPFSATLPFVTPSTPTGTLILEKDNPSGDAAHSAQITIPVQF
jgi:hypothetical protein